MTPCDAIYLLDDCLLLVDARFPMNAFRRDGWETSVADELWYQVVDDTTLRVVLVLYGVGQLEADLSATAVEFGRFAETACTFCVLPWYASDPFWHRECKEMLTKYNDHVNMAPDRIFL